MKLKLTSDDRSEIDLLLGEAATAAKAPSPGYVAAAGAQHVEAVRRVLQLLQVLPAADPPVDLVDRTLARISQTSGQLIEAPEIGKAADRHAHRPA